MDLTDFISNVKPHQAADKLSPFLEEIQKLKGIGYSASQISTWLNTRGIDVTAAQVLEFMTLSGGGSTPVSEAIRALLGDPSKRTLVSLVRTHYEEIQQALDSGVTVATLVKRFTEQGIKVTQASFQTCITRVRAERRAADEKGAKS